MEENRIHIDVDTSKLTVKALMELEDISQRPSLTSQIEWLVKHLGVNREAIEGLSANEITDVLNTLFGEVSKVLQRPKSNGSAS